MKQPWAAICADFGPRLMHDFGLSAIQAAGIMGNLGRESGGGRWMQELGGGGGRGIAQWTGPRARSFQAWCAHHGVSTSSDAGNYGYLKFELSGAYAPCITKLKRCTTLESATTSFCNSFERPGVPAYADRFKWARTALAAFSPGHAASVAPVAKPRARKRSDRHAVAAHHVPHHKHHRA